jgi:CxxC motif-containing protein
VEKMAEDTKIICIGCPKGCHININYEGKTINSVSDYGCKIGFQYAQNEFTKPTRIVTTLVKVKNGELPMVPVKTRNPIDKVKIFECMNTIRELEVEAPISIGTVVKSNLNDTGVDLVATKNIKKVVKN